MTQAERLAETRARILETADRLFYGQGIRAVGVDTIAAEAGLSKPTLYNHFPSKEALILAYLERRFRIAEASDAPPLEQIRRYFERLEHSIAAPEDGTVAEFFFAAGQLVEGGAELLRFEEQG